VSALLAIIRKLCISQGMRVSVTVGSVVPTSMMGISSFRDTRNAMWQFLPLRRAEHIPSILIEENF